jgi:N-acetylglucosaminyldiphosphoundecaprenol N-acetyl-beta-D-mannosaminyltransferase
MKTPSKYDRFDVLGCMISATNLESAVETAIDQVNTGQGGYICFSNVHTVVTSVSDSKLKKITNESFMSLPDGKPLSIVGRFRDKVAAKQVAGPDFMPALLQHPRSGRHYFYGSTPETLELLRNHITSNFPTCIIAGMYSPPFRELSAEERKVTMENIRAAKPDFIWVGLGAPKQEYWMGDVAQELKPAILLGVGAAFDFHAGTLARSPLWMRRYGLEWLYRLAQEPRRLFSRYATTNFLFLYYLAQGYVLGLLRK